MFTVTDGMVGTAPFAVNLPHFQDAIHRRVTYQGGSNFKVHGV